MPSKNSKLPHCRLWEVDCLRGSAVLLMLVSNFVFDLGFFGYMESTSGPFWPGFARCTAASFLLIAGISLTLSRARLQAAGTLSSFPHFFKRGSKIVALGLLISLATWFAVGQEMVVFGILHLIGLGSILAAPFLGRPLLALLAAFGVFGAGLFLSDTVVSFPWLLWLGLQYDGFSSVDYTPLCPWFGFMLLGMVFGAWLFPYGRRRWVLPVSAENGAIRLLRLFGSHSLLIYFGHQPVFWGGFWVYRNVL